MIRAAFRASERATRFMAALAVCVGVASCSVEGANSPGAKTASAPDFSLPSTEGKKINLSDYLGKSVILLDFWSTTCEPCMVEMPHLVDLYKANKDRGFVILAISVDGPESIAEVNRVVHDKEMIFPVLLDQETAVTARYNPKRELPFSILIDKTGKIIQKRAGYQPGDEKTLDAEIEKALR